MVNNNIYLYDLRVEYQKNPVGIDVLKPRISWKIKSEKRATKQTAYRIQVAFDSNFNQLSWDSGLVESEKSVHVEYQGPDLKSGMRYYYRIKIKDQAGKTSDWSSPAYWEMGLLTAAEWQAEWVTNLLESRSEFDKYQPCPLFRKDFKIENKIKAARLYISALGLYELTLNGDRVGDYYFTPGWTSYHNRLQYQTYDLTDLLNRGNNTLGVMLGNGWYKGDLMWNDKRNFYGNKTAFLLQLELSYQDGRKKIITSDQSWKTTAGPVLMSEIYHGETYDARQESAGWNQPGYNDQSWSAVKVLAKGKQHLVAQENEPVKQITELKAKEIFTTPAGEKVIDLGQNMVGWVRFRVEGQAGEEVILKHAEVLDQNGNFYTGNLRSARQTVKYILKGERVETFEPHFTFQGFRYLKLEKYPGEPSLSDFTGVVLHSAMERIGDFSCSNPLVNQLFENIIWGQKGNFLDLPTDCPQRDERLGWTGDAQVFAQTASYNMNVALFFTKWLRDLKAEQAENGAVPVVIPDPELNLSKDAEKIIPVASKESSAAWGDAAVIVPWILYLSYADQRILSDQYESMKAYIDYIRQQGDNEYLWNTGFHFGDWVALDATENSYKGATSDDFVATAYYAYSTRLLVKVAELLGKNNDVKKYSQLLQRIIDNFQQEFVTPNGRLSEPTQTAHVLALYFDLVKTEDRERLSDQLAEYVAQRDGHLTTGFVGTPYLCHVLSNNGYPELAYKLLEREEYPSWLYSVTKGATTIWEHWDGIKEDGSFWPDAMNSFNHYAYGSIGDWLYQVAAGLNTDQIQPGFKKSIITPQPGGSLTSARASINSIYGRVESDWKISGQQMKVKVTIPANTTAIVVLPNALIKTIKVDGVLLKDNNFQIAGIHKFKNLVEGVELEIGSGKYCFEFTRKEE